jgi:hypothetical protein
MRSELRDLWDCFLDSALETINESAREGSFVPAEFVLEAERKTPWKSREDWFDEDEDNSKIGKNKAMNRFKKGGRPVEFRSFILNLLPASQSGLNVCICATGDCARHCLHTAGNVGALADKTISRARKTWMMFFDPAEAFRQIALQLANKKKKIDEENRADPSKFRQMIVRLNGTSDLVWRAVRGVSGENLFEMFPEVAFYDYVKLPFEMEAFIKGFDHDGKEFPKNYHMTFSYNGRWNKSHDFVLGSGHNVTVAFGPGKTASLDYAEFPKDMGFLLRNVLYPSDVKGRKERAEYLKSIMDKVEEEGNFMTPEELAPFAGQTLLPGLYKCHEVVDGDGYDARFLDDFLLAGANRPSGSEDESEVDADFQSRPKKDHGIVIGLASKGSLPFMAYTKEGGWNADATGFMVGPNDPGLDYDCDLNLNDASRASFLKRKTDAFRKISKAIYTIRNFDARHLEPGDKVFRSAGDREGTQTYDAAGRRATQEIDQIIKVIQDVMAGREPGVGMYDRHKKSAVGTATALISYLKDPAVQARVRDSEFLTKAVEMGMGLDVDNLIKRIERLPAGEPKPSILSLDLLGRFADLLSGAGKRIVPSWRRSKVDFKEWLEIVEGGHSVPLRGEGPVRLEAKGHAKPVQPPKEKSNKIEFEDAKERIPVGRKNTTMDSRPKRMRTRGSQKRGAMRDQDS